jgi:hypothetical protein
MWILFFFSNPPTIRQQHLRNLVCYSFSCFLAAIKAASLHTLAISAPEKPGVCLAKKSVSNPSTFSWF